MASKPWYAFYTADYAGKTKWFTSAAQHGIYRCLLDYHYDEGSLPLDESELRGVTRATLEEWTAYWPAIRARYFVERDGRLWNKRAEKEITTRARRLNRRSKAAKTAASARWAPKPETPVGEPTRDEIVAVEAYNTLAAKLGLAKCQTLNKSRRAKIAARLRDAGGLAGWAVALEKIEASTFLRGGGDRGWKANIDFLCQESSFAKVMEGAYDNPIGGPTGAKPSGHRQGDGSELGAAVAAISILRPNR